MTKSLRNSFQRMLGRTCNHVFSLKYARLHLASGGFLVERHTLDLEQVLISIKPEHDLAGLVTKPR